MDTRTETRQIVGDFNLGLTENTSLDYAQSTVDTWKTFADVCRERRYHHEGCDIIVQVDWRPVYELLAVKLHDSLEWFSDPPPGMKKVVMYRVMSDDEQIEDTATSITAHIEISGHNELSNRGWYPEFFLETYLYDAFLILNLAHPGSAEFYNLEIHDSGRSIERLGLSAYYWWSAYQLKDQWPLLDAIDPRVTSAWFLNARHGFGQIPETPVERAMFALLHVCQSSGRPEDIVWLFYGFESLFQTHAGENFSALVERLLLILQPDANQEKRLRKQLRTMYDTRSSFVHGGFNVVHPMQADTIDKRVDDLLYGKIGDLSEYGAKILLACLQRYVQENWIEVRYKTKTIIEPINSKL